MAAGFPAKTSFTDGSVLPASDLNDLGGTINKVYNAGTYPNQLSYRSSSDSILRPIPWGVAAGKINYTSNINPGGVASVSVTFVTPARFTLNPIVTATAEVTGSTNVYASCSTDSVQTSGFTARIYNVASGSDRIITNTYVHYHAIQMTGNDASNNG